MNSANWAHSSFFIHSDRRAAADCTLSFLFRAQRIKEQKNINIDPSLRGFISLYIIEPSRFPKYTVRFLSFMHFHHLLNHAPHIVM